MNLSLKHLKLLCPLLFVGLMGVFFLSCDDDEKTQTVPIVTTAAVTDITPNSATVGGEITSDGNATVTASGIVYSSVVGEPTLADDKIELTDTEGDFSTTLGSLNSGTMYHIRAYATNSVGTGYGPVVNFTTGNAAPVATNVSVTGTVEVNKLLTGTYTYADSEADAEAGSTFKWYVANDATGTGEAAIAGATANTYTIQAAEQGKYIRFGVTPKAAAGNTTGTEVKSAFVGAVGEATTVTFTYNGQSVTYSIINSAATGKKWLDRNLGAPNTPTAFDNYQNYGDLFQWGRLADGHQLINRGGANDADMAGVNGTTSIDPPYETSSTDNPGHALFIVLPGGPIPTDWRDPQNNNLWQGVNGVNNPCPAGWRIATQEEWTAENITSIADGYTKLKLTLTGAHTFAGTFIQSATAGSYWSSTIDESDPTNPRSIRLRFDGAYTVTIASRASGYACRCIKD